MQTNKILFQLQTKERFSVADLSVQFLAKVQFSGQQKTADLPRLGSKLGLESELG